MEGNIVQKRKASVFDMDGTCSLHTGIRNPYDTAKCLDDLPNEPVLDLLRLFQDAEYRIIICSGREDKFMDLTCDWLAEHAGLKSPGFDYEIYMRKTGDLRPDDVIKNEIYESHIKDKYDVRAVVDDRLRVCKLWHRLGLPLFRVGDPEATF